MNILIFYYFRQAKENKVNMWKDYTAPVESGDIKEKNFTATVSIYYAFGALTLQLLTCRIEHKCISTTSSFEKKAF